MDIILLKNIEKVGRKFEIVTVKNGYGRNYLIPQGLALIANKANRNNLFFLRYCRACKLEPVPLTRAFFVGGPWRMKKHISYIYFSRENLGRKKAAPLLPVSASLVGCRKSMHN